MRVIIRSITSYHAYEIYAMRPIGIHIIVTSNLRLWASAHRLTRFETYVAKLFNFFFLNKLIEFNLYRVSISSDIFFEFLYHFL